MHALSGISVPHGRCHSRSSRVDWPGQHSPHASLFAQRPPAAVYQVRVVVVGQLVLHHWLMLLLPQRLRRVRLRRWGLRLTMPPLRRARLRWLLHPHRALLREPVRGDRPWVRPTPWVPPREVGRCSICRTQAHAAQLPSPTYTHLVGKCVSRPFACDGTGMPHTGR